MHMRRVRGRVPVRDPRHDVLRRRIRSRVRGNSWRTLRVLRQRVRAVTKLKSPAAERIAAIRRKECVVEGCVRPLHGYGFCRECLTEMDNRMIALAEAAEKAEKVSEARGFARGTAMVRAYVQSLCDQLEVLRVENERLRLSAMPKPEPKPEPSRDELLHALARVLAAYDRVVPPNALGCDPMNAADIAEARKLLNTVLERARS